MPTHLSPDGGIGRRAGLKHQWGNPSRFDPGSGYRETLVELLYEGFSFVKNAKMVTFGHLLKNGVQKNGKKGLKKMSEISLFEGKQQIIIFMINPNSQF